MRCFVEEQSLSVHLCCRRHCPRPERASSRCQSTWLGNRLCGLEESCLSCRSKERRDRRRCLAVRVVRKSRVWWVYLLGAYLRDFDERRCRRRVKDERRENESKRVPRCRGDAMLIEGRLCA